jgi:glycerophosphoryl diester phosphodiesterase
MQRFSLHLFFTLWYAAASTIFAVEIIAHRGASHDAPENTLAAFNLAWKQKADAVELDIWLTKDGKIVCLHDGNTKRIAGRDNKVADQTLAELHVLDAGKWKSRQWIGERIPTLYEALATMPDGKRLFIEIKCGPEVLPELERVINASGKKPQQLAIIAFSFTVASLAKAKLPEIEVSWLYNWKKDKDSGDKLTGDQLILKAREAKLDGLDVQFKGPIDAAFVTKVKGAGLKLYVWTVDKPAAAKQLMAADVDGITTNRPEWLRKRLEE